MHVVFFFLKEKVTSALQLLLAIGYEFAAKSLNCVVEIFPGEDNAWTRRQGLDFGASIT